MQDVSTKWYYESDGDEHRRTHYLCNDSMMDATWDGRIDCSSRAHAIKLRDALNAPMPAGVRPSRHIVDLLLTAWPNLHIEGFDEYGAEQIIRTIIGQINNNSTAQSTK